MSLVPAPMNTGVLNGYLQLLSGVGWGNVVGEGGGRLLYTDVIRIVAGVDF